jgi:hypothetical protein
MESSNEARFQGGITSITEISGSDLVCIVNWAGVLSVCNDWFRSEESRVSEII